MYANDKISRVSLFNSGNLWSGDLFWVAIEYDWATGADPGFVGLDAYTIWRTSLRKQFKNIFVKFYKNDDFVNPSQNLCKGRTFKNVTKP